MPIPSIWGLFIIIASAFTASALLHPTPRSELKRRDPAPDYTPLAPPPYVPTLDNVQHEYLRAHNRLRRRVNVHPLSWDPELAAAAHAWAETRRVDCDYRHHSPNPYGENIYWESYNEFDPMDVVDSWFQEARFYNHTTMSCTCVPERENCECGHYLNVIWSTTRRVGCSGTVYCDDQNGIYVVCNYDPTGLTPGINPFTGLKIKGYQD